MRRLAAVALLVLLGMGSVPPAGATIGTELHRVLVRFADHTDADAVLASVGARTIGTVHGTDVRIATITGPDAATAAARLARDPAVDYAEPDFPLRIALDAPNDPRYGDQYALARINALAGWTVHPGTYAASGGPTIAVIDTGIDRNHEDLADRVDAANSSCFLGLLCLIGGWGDDNGHGTHVAGTAAAASNNGRGVAGVAYDSRVMALKVCNAVGTCNTSAVASAIHWAAERGAAVINMSLGGSGDSATLRNAVRDAWDAGVVLVAAAGNDGNRTKNYPASYPHVISVAATDRNDARASFSNFNDDVELAAPGVGILSSYPGNAYRSLSGTSMASPHVAGLAALLRGQNAGWTNAQVRQRMQSCSEDLGAPGRDDEFGHGRIDLGRALGDC